jgi:group I intron endonuclease
MKRDLTKVIGYIYKLTSPNGKIYIGQTINKKQRKYHYKTLNFKQQIKLWNSSQCYNWNPSSTFEIIEECLCGKDKIFLNGREIYWISFYDSFKNGLNCNEGGKGNTGIKHTEETKTKMSKSGKLKPPMSQETKNLLSELNSGKNNPMYGKKHTNEVKDKISKFNTGVIFSDKTKINMSLAAKNRPPISDETRNKKIKNSLGNKNANKKIVQIDSNGNHIKMWDSITECKLELNLRNSGISKVLTGKSKTTNGYKFIYII